MPDNKPLDASSVAPTIEETHNIDLENFKNSVSNPSNISF
jgi:hypothetical protein